jgi:ubiquinone/menaquinone biosynthesis C-methylase UbiE
LLLEMSTTDDAKKKAAATYNAAADFYDHPANTFWERYGRNTIKHLQLSPGARVLDVCCGSGASALAAAAVVGPNGSVTGVDLAENLLELARAKAAQRGLTNVSFQTGDLTDLKSPDGALDAVVWVFGIFFVPDMEAALRELRRVLRPGGGMAITTWGPRLFEPLNTAFWNSVRSVKPELYKGFNPWDRICEADALRALLASAGLQDIEVTPEMDSQPVNSFDDWWALVLGSGYRGTVDQLSTAERDRVKAESLDFIDREQIRSVETNVLYARASA